MATPCTNNPDEVIAKIVGAKQNADLFDKFVNGLDTEVVQLGVGTPTPTIRNAIRQLLADASWAKSFMADAPEGDVSLNNATAMASSASRTLAERFADVVNVKDFGAKGDGVTDDAAAINAAVLAGEGKAVFFPAGTYLTSTGIRIPSDTAVFGAGEDVTVIKLTSPYSCIPCVTNDKNFWHDYSWVTTHTAYSYETQIANTGNSDIYLGYLTVDGNGWREQSSVAGASMSSAVEFANIHNSTLEHVKAINGRLHCIDICSAMYSAHYEEGATIVHLEEAQADYFGDWYIGKSTDVTLINCTGVNPRSDDNITTHYSGNINMYAPVAYFTDGASIPENNCGVEIDDGSLNVNVFGGSAKGCGNGFCAKAHNPAYPSYDIHVYSFVAEKCQKSYMLSHDYYTASYSPLGEIHPEMARGYIFRDCVSIEPESRDLHIVNVHDCIIENFRCYGDGETIHSSSPILLTEKVYDCEFNGFYLYNIKTSSNVPLITINDSVEEGISFDRVIARDCYAIYLIADYRVSKTIFLNDIHWYASANETNTALLYTYASNLLSEYTVLGGFSGSNYLYDIKDNYYNTFPRGQFFRKRLVGKKGDKTCCKIGGHVSTDTGPYDYYVQKYCLIEDVYGISTGEQLLIGFEHKDSRNGTAPQVVAYVGAIKHGPAVSWGLAFGTCYESGGGLSTKWEIYSPGTLLPSVDNSYNIGRPSYRIGQLYAGTATINTSDLREKDNLKTPSEALMRAWGKIGFKVFQFKEAVEKKGTEARLHIGVVAQQVRDAFAEEGLDAGRYALFCHDAWEEEYEEIEIEDKPQIVDENGNVLQEAVKHTERRKTQDAGDRYGIRYEEALALECAYQRWLGEKREARIAALEAKLAAMEE